MLSPPDLLDKSASEYGILSGDILERATVLRDACDVDAGTFLYVRALVVELLAHSCAPGVILPLSAWGDSVRGNSVTALTPISSRTKLTLRMP